MVDVHIASRWGRIDSAVGRSKGRTYGGHKARWVWNKIDFPQRSGWIWQSSRLLRSQSGASEVILLHPGCYSSIGALDCIAHNAAAWSVTALESLQLAQIGDSIRQRGDPLHQGQSRLPHGRVFGHHQHVGEETVDRLPQPAEPFRQRGHRVAIR